LAPKSHSLRLASSRSIHLRRTGSLRISCCVSIRRDRAGWSSPCLQWPRSCVTASACGGSGGAGQAAERRALGSGAVILPGLRSGAALASPRVASMPSLNALAGAGWCRDVSNQAAREVLLAAPYTPRNRREEAHRTFVERLVESHRENVCQLRGIDAVPSLDSIAARNSNARCCPARVRRHPATHVFVRCLPNLPSDEWQNRAGTAIWS